LPPFYAEHGIVSTIDVVIKGSDDQPYGVLEIDNDQQHDYDQHDIDFLTGFANVLAEAVATSVRTSILQHTIDRMKVLVEEKDRLLEQKKVLAEELQHRVRNNLQLVYGMLSKQLDDTPDTAGQRGIKAISRRVSTLAQVYDHLLGNEMTRTTDFGSYVKSLCLNLAEIQAAPDGYVTLTCDSEAIVLDLDVVTALGIVVAEVVTNSYDHAFPRGKRGSIIVSVRRAEGDADIATMTISDDGPGFLAKAESKRHGLGLVRRLVEQVRGSAVVDSDHGTVWTIRIPVEQWPLSLEQAGAMPRARLCYCACLNLSSFEDRHSDRRRKRRWSGAHRRIARRGIETTVHKVAEEHSNARMSRPDRHRNLRTPVRP
jgi:two-component sensor histidine kinase